MFFLAQSIGFEPTSLLSQRFSRPLPHHPDICHIVPFSAVCLQVVRKGLKATIPLVGEVGFEPTQRKGNGFTVRPDSPTSALPDIINKAVPQTPFTTALLTSLRTV